MENTGLNSIDELMMAYLLEFNIGFSDLLCLDIFWG